MQQKFRRSIYLAILVALVGVSINVTSASAAVYKKSMANVVSVKSTPIAKQATTIKNPIIRKPIDGIAAVPVVPPKVAAPAPVLPPTISTVSQYPTQDSSYTQYVDADNNLVISEQMDGITYKVSVPDPTAIEYARYRLRSIKNCSREIGSYIGQPKPYVGNIISDKTVIDPNQSVGSCCGAAPEYPIVNRMPNANFQSLAFSPTAFWRSLPSNFTNCPGGHEELHRFVHSSFFNGWANEGLAEMMEQKFRSAPSLISCSDDSFTAIGFTGTTITLPYRRVSELNQEPRIYSYYTYACLWKRIDTQYGHEQFKNVINTAFHIVPNQNTNFWRDVLESNLGSDIWTFLGRLGIARPN